MNRQQLLDNFIFATAGKGQCTVTGSPECLYVKEDHLGCAIGCQPGFREKFGKKAWVVENALLDDVLLGTLWGTEEKAAAQEFFGNPDSNDIEFLRSLQGLHDLREHWDGKEIKPEALQSFCEHWKLKIPQESS